MKTWQRRLVLFSAGAASVLAFAPFHVWPVLWFTLPILFYGIVETGRNTGRHNRYAPWQKLAAGRAAENAWWFGFGYFVLGLIWIAEAFLVEAEVFAWLIPFAVFGLPAGLALFFAVAGAVTRFWLPATVFGRVLLFALSLGATEWLRGHILSGFPWNVLGYALTMPLTLLQSVGLFGIYGLTLLVCMIFVWPVATFVSRSDRRTVGLLDRFVFAVGICFATIAGLYGYGHFRLANSEHSAVTDEIKVRIVQPSVVQREKWRPENQRAIFDLHKALSVRPTTNQSWLAAKKNAVPELIVWPEAAMPFFPLDQPIALDEIGAMLSARQVLIAGGLRRGVVVAGEQGSRVFNSVLVFDDGASANAGRARSVAIYDKAHLVPFGEYLPLQGMLEKLGLEQLSRLRGGFASGARFGQPLDIVGVGRLIPLVCYEAIFPFPIELYQERARALLNVTNDGWFGDSIGPRQHLHQARVRAVEAGVPLIRAANNGISVMVDGAGQIVGRLDMNRTGVIDATLPPVLNATTYGRFGDKTFLVMLFVFLMLLGFDRYRNGSSRDG